MSWVRSAQHMFLFFLHSHKGDHFGLGTHVRTCVYAVTEIALPVETCLLDFWSPSEVWSNGKGELKRAKAALKSGSFTGSAKTTLDMEQRAEEWAKFKVKGCEEVAQAAQPQGASGSSVDNVAASSGPRPGDGVVVKRVHDFVTPKTSTQTALKP